MEGRTEHVGHSTATAKTTADCVRFDRMVTATTERGPPGQSYYLSQSPSGAKYI